MALQAAQEDPKQKTISPYELTSGDNPGAVIPQPLLNGNNYDQFSYGYQLTQEICFSKAGC